MKMIKAVVEFPVFEEGDVYYFNSEDQEVWWPNGVSEADTKEALKAMFEHEHYGISPSETLKIIDVEITDSKIVYDEDTEFVIK